MLSEIRIENFRCFANHAVPLRATTVMVGRNNAGKSTIVESLRLISIIQNRFRGFNFVSVPSWLDISSRIRGVRPSLEGMQINFGGLFHAYGDPPAKITATFSSGEKIVVYLGPKEDVFGVIQRADGTPVVSKAQARNLELPDISILPQVGPLLKEERVLNADYVRRAASSALAPLHFRNQINLFFDCFPKFKELAESTWPTLRVEELSGRSGLPEEPLALLLRDSNFVTEVSSMGHGLQMWLQTIWFLARTPRDHTVILDEPDVYMHADLQRKLIRLLTGHFKQAIVATHSIEIMAEVDPDQILIVDRRQAESNFATSVPAVQHVVHQIGGVHNLHLARLWTSRRCLLIEGKDIAFLKRLQDTLFASTEDPVDTIPHMSIGGWSGWPYAVGSSKVLKNAVDEAIRVYCILDSDYYTPDEIKERLIDAQVRGVNLHIWRRKEIENYFLVPEAISRVIWKGARRGIQAPTAAAVRLQIDRIAETIKEELRIALTNQLLLRNRAAGLPPAMRAASARIDAAWSTFEGRISMISGKQVLSELSRWSTETFGVSFGAKAICNGLKVTELAQEVIDVMSAIEHATALPVSGWL